MKSWQKLLKKLDKLLNNGQSMGVINAISLIIQDEAG